MFCRPLGRGYPLALDVPNTPATRELLRNFVAGIVDHGPSVLVDTQQVAKAHDRQTAGNCTFANAVPGLTCAQRCS